MKPNFNQVPKARIYKSEEIEKTLSVTMRKDKIGTMFYCVSWIDYHDNESYCTFKHFSSVLDFIESNFS